MESSREITDLKSRFPEKMLGHITECIDPFGNGTTLSSALDFFNDNQEYTAWPVETENGSLGILQRDILIEKGKSTLEKIRNRKAAEYSFPIKTTHDARDNCQAVAAEIVQNETPANLLVIYSAGRFMGILPAGRLLKHAAHLRSREVGYAREIQEFLLNRSQPEHHSFTYCYLLKQSNDIGGDFYQAIKLGNRTLLASFDVSGKNVSASLATSMISAILATLEEIQEQQHSPSELLVLLNNILCRITPLDLFVAGLFYFINPDSSEIEIFNFGYSKMFIVAPGENETWKIAAAEPQLPPLGIDSIHTPAVVEKGRLSLSRRNKLTLISWSDGLEDLQNPSGQKFGEKRIEDFVRKNYSLTPERFIAALEETIEEFRRNAPRPDDITALCVKF